VGTAITKRISVAYCIFWVLEFRSVQKLVLIRVVALCVHPFMHFRMCMSAFHRTYKYLASFEKDTDLVPLTPDIKDELGLAGLLLVCAITDIRTQVNTHITEADATPTGG